MLLNLLKKKKKASISAFGSMLGSKNELLDEAVYFHIRVLRLKRADGMMPTVRLCDVN